MYFIYRIKEENLVLYILVCHLFKYFACQLGGYDPMCEDIRRQFEKHLKPGLNGVSYFLFAFITWVHLLFAITGEDVKWLIQKVRNIILLFDCKSTIK